MKNSLNHPFYEVAAQASKLIEEGRGKVETFQKFTCSHCGSRQTMAVPNVFYKLGDCEECGKRTDIEKSGCNFLVTASTSAPNIDKVLFGRKK